MRSAGIDIGSRAVKLAVVENGRLTDSRVVDSTFDSLRVARELTRTLAAEQLVATGYGRHRFAEVVGCPTITELKAVAKGARLVWPTCRTILDVGGQDTKAVALDEQGRMNKFALNDRCAAGTGRFLEVMAAAMGVPLDGLVEEACAAPRGEKLSSMCAVFAESEVISLVARGAERGPIALGIHQASAVRTAALVRRVPLADDLLFVGGGALNGCLRREIAATLGRAVHVPEQPQLVAALGAAMCAQGGAAAKEV